MYRYLPFNIGLSGLFFFFFDIDKCCRNDSNFLHRQVWANIVNLDQTAHEGIANVNPYTYSKLGLWCPG